MTTASVALSPDGLSLKVIGVLEVEALSQLADKADNFIRDVADPLFDLTGVTKAESATLALLVAWRRQAHMLGKTARFIHVPKQLMDIAKLSNVQDILGLSEEGGYTGRDEHNKMNNTRRPDGQTTNHR